MAPAPRVSDLQHGFPDRPGIRIAVILLLGFGVALHTYTATVLASSFHAGFWLWSISPYLIVALMFWAGRLRFAVLGAVILPAIVDLLVHLAVFHAPQGSTAALGLVAAPLWNLVLFMPLGGVLGWLVDRRVRRSSANTDLTQETQS
jgi:hypothetical protein